MLSLRSVWLFGERNTFFYFSVIPFGGGHWRDRPSFGPLNKHQQEIWFNHRAATSRPLTAAGMDLLVFYPETTEPKRRHFDGPVLLGVEQALGENAEVIPGFSTIPCDGMIQRCVAYCDPGEC